MFIFLLVFVVVVVVVAFINDGSVLIFKCITNTCFYLFPRLFSSSKNLPYFPQRDSKKKRNFSSSYFPILVSIWIQTVSAIWNLIYCFYIFFISSSSYTYFFFTYFVETKIKAPHRIILFNINNFVYFFAVFKTK